MEGAIMDLMGLLLNGAGGAILGPLVSQFLGGKHQSMLTRIIAGMIGGVGAGAGADAAGVSATLSSILGDSNVMSMVQSVLEGGVGGGVLSTLAGMMKKKA
jgi:hypothetical protein